MLNYSVKYSPANSNLAQIKLKLSEGNLSLF